ncbi:MAG TPA: patatin-like phospholipase family protein [Solirubrobacteraceae bacterium]
MNTTAQQTGAEDLRADFVFEGGGVKGIGLSGAYRELTDRGYTAECVAGTSAGAINAALVACGFTGPEVEDVALHRMKFPDFEDKTFLDRFGKPGEAAEFFRTRGMHSGDYFLNWMRELLKEKGITRFGQLRNPDATSPERTYRLQVIASDLSARSMLVLPHDAAKIGCDPDDLEIALAVRMSMSIPIFFNPVTPVDHDGNQHVIVDGGLLSNYPIWLFDAPGDAQPEFPTFGMLLVAPNQKAPLVATAADAELADVSSDLGFLKAMEATVTQAHDRFYVEQANYARTIPIPTLGVRTTEFDISPERTQALFDSGKQAAAQFLSTWDFQAYKDKFRSGTTPSRRDTVTPR